MTEQYDGYPVVLITDHVVNKQRIIYQQLPPAFISKVTEIRSVFAVPTVIVRNDGQPTCRSQTGESPVAMVMFTEPME